MRHGLPVPPLGGGLRRAEHRGRHRPNRQRTIVVQRLRHGHRVAVTSLIHGPAQTREAVPATQSGRATTPDKLAARIGALPTARTIKLPPCKYQPFKPEEKESHDMPGADAEMMRSAFFRPIRAPERQSVRANAHPDRSQDWRIARLAFLPALRGPRTDPGQVSPDRCLQILSSKMETALPANSAKRVTDSAKLRQPTRPTMDSWEAALGRVGAAGGRAVLADRSGPASSVRSLSA